MELVTGKTYYGFTVKKEEAVPDCKGTLFTLEHNQSGAQLLYLNREDENKTFAIAFKTIPENDTGVFHILEHSVLNGSRKYPVKEPFVELLKGSLQTFLNAMTYPDKTLFPVASRNDKDFMNLMDTYLDAVLYPRIYAEPNIFYQEGWHYDIHDEESNPTYQGVVYSEMQGAFSSIDEVIMNEANKALFKGTCYEYESGGDPKAIVTLSYEEFIQAHKKFYHPSNSRIFLDGTMDIEAVLKKIDEDYLSKFERIDVSDIQIEEIQPVKQEKRHRYYEIGEEENSKNRTVIAYAKVIGNYKDVSKIVAYSALQDMLVGSNESILKKNLLSEGLCEDVELAIIDGMKWPIMLLVLRNTEKENEEKIYAIIHETIQTLIKNGLDYEMIEASLNQMEFSYLEPSEPAGVMYADDALKSWLYDDDPLIYLNRSGIYDELRKKLHEGYFEELLQEYFLHDEDLVTMVFEPSKQLAKQRMQSETEALMQAKASWDNVQDYIDLTENLVHWQETPNSKEDLETLPKLSLSDINPKAERYEPTIQEIKSVPVLLYPQENSGIVYFNLYFSLAGIKKEDLPMVSLYTRLLADLPTQKHSVEELQKLIRRDIGSLSISTSCLPIYDDPSVASPLLVVSCSVLEQNVEKAKDLILEILKETRFEKEDIKPFIAQGVENARQALSANGQSIALLKALSSYSASASASEYMTGFHYMTWLNAFMHDDTKMDQFIEQANLYSDVLFSSSRMTVSLNDETYMPVITSIIDALPSYPFERCVVHYALEPCTSTGIVIPSQVSYVAKACDLNSQAYAGYVNVLSQILTYEYLWNEVRVKSGAYGTGFNAGMTGVLSMYSYRDPSPEKTIETFSHISEFIEAFMNGTKDLTSYIIGTIASASPLLSPSSRIRSSDRQYFSKITYENRQANRTRILSSTPEKLLELAPMIQKSMLNAVICVVGPQEVMEKCGITRENIKRLG